MRATKELVTVAPACEIVLRMTAEEAAFLRHAALWDRSAYEVFLAALAEALGEVV